MNLFDRIALFQSHLDGDSTLGAGGQQVVVEFCFVDLGFGLQVKPVNPDFQGTKGFLQRFLEVTADRHRFADGLHADAKAAVGCSKLFKGKARQLGDYVVDGRFEAGRGFLGNVVGQLIKGIARRKLGRELRDRESGRLGGQRGGPRYARIHFDDGQTSGFRVNAELYIRSAGFNPDDPQDLQRRIAHDLVFAIGQGLGRSHRDGIAGMDAHRVHVLDSADDDGVVFLVAHHFHLEFLPAEHGFLEQDFRSQAGLEAAFRDGHQLIHVLGNAAARTAEREGGANDNGKIEIFVGYPTRFIKIVHVEALQRFNAGFGHRGLE